MITQNPTPPSPSISTSDSNPIVDSPSKNTGEKPNSTPSQPKEESPHGTKTAPDERTKSNTQSEEDALLETYLPGYNVSNDPEFGSNRFEDGNINASARYYNVLDNLPPETLKKVILKVREKELATEAANDQKDTVTEPMEFGDSEATHTEVEYKDKTFNQLTVQDLREELRKRNLLKTGNKVTLRERLEFHLEEEGIIDMETHLFKTIVKPKEKKAKDDEHDVLENIKKMKEIRADGLRRMNTGLSNNHNLIGNPLLDAGVAFEEKLKNVFKNPANKCVICHESDYGLYVGRHTKKCKRCAREFNAKFTVLTYSMENRMIPGDIPPCLADLTYIEQCSIKLACPLLHIYR